MLPALVGVLSWPLWSVVSLLGAIVVSWAASGVAISAAVTSAMVVSSEVSFTVTVSVAVVPGKVAGALAAVDMTVVAGTVMIVAAETGLVPSAGAVTRAVNLSSAALSKGASAASRRSLLFLLWPKVVTFLALRGTRLARGGAANAVLEQVAVWERFVGPS